MIQKLKGVFRCLDDHEVKYVVIGGIAAVLHGVPRTTFDLDVLIEATVENAGRLLLALLEAGWGTAALTTPEEILANVQPGWPPGPPHSNLPLKFLFSSETIFRSGGSRTARFVPPPPMGEVRW